MVKRYKPPSSVSGPRSLGGSENGSCSRRGSYKDKDEDQTFCVVLHVVEAINFCGRDGENEQIVMNAALNTVDFEIEGQPSATSETIIFNSNCIWECDMAGIKRIKTDHRPVKVTFYACGGQPERKTIGSLLLPVRGLPVLSSAGNQSALQLKMFWHKLICISNEFRSHKPEVLLMLAIIKKSLLHTQDFEHLMQFANQKSPQTPPLQSPGHSITANMLHSQANVYVQSLVQLGLLQVGNDPLIDCDIIEVVLQLKQLKNVCKLAKSLNLGKDVNTVLLVFDFVGNVTNIELKLNEKDSYVLNDVLGLRFKSSLRSMRLYFQRIFYLPINMYINGTAIANYRMDFGKLMPSDSYFADNRKYVRNDSFTFNRLGRMDSARELKPLIEYTFSVDIKSVYSRQSQHGQIEDDIQPSLSSTSSVIRKLSDQLKDSEANSISWQHHDSASVASLNVGAELSDSGNEVDVHIDSPVDVDNNEDDPPKDLPKSQGRRKKFTRLTANQDSQDSDEDVCLVKKFSSMVVREPLEHEQMEQEDHPEILSSDFDEDVLALYNNKKFSKEKRTLDTDINEVKKCTKQKSPLKRRESGVKLEEQKSMQIDNKDSKKIVTELNKEPISKTNIKHLKKLSCDKLELHKGYVSKEEPDSSKIESTKESNRVKKCKSSCNSQESNNENASHEFLQKDLHTVEKLNKLKKTKAACEHVEIYNEDFPNRQAENENRAKKPNPPPMPKHITIQSEEKFVRNARKLEEINAADLQQLPLMESILGKKERLRNRQQKLEIIQNVQLADGEIRKKSIQKIGRTGKEVDEEDESENSFSHSNSRCGRKCSRDEECTKRTDSSMDFFNKEVLSELRSKKCKVQKHLIRVTNDPYIDDSEHLNVVEHEGKRKLKPQPFANDHRKLPKEVKEVKRDSRNPKSETSLSARWVEVKQNQEKVIRETENYIEQTCKTNEKHIRRSKIRTINNHNIIMEDIAIPSTIEPKRRISKKQNVLEEEHDQDLLNQTENCDEYLSLKVIDSQSTITNFLSTSELVESEAYEEKPVKRVVRKKILKKSEAEIEEPSKSMEIKESFDHDPVEPFKKKITKRIPRKLIESGHRNNAEKVDNNEVVPDDRIKKNTNKNSSSELKDDHETMSHMNKIEMASWKKQQMERFEQELESKMDDFQLEQMTHVEQLSESFTDAKYESKFINLEENVVKLKLEMEEQVGYFHQQNQKMTDENTQLRLEKSQLEEHISRMKNEIQQLRQNKHSPEVGQELKQVLDELAKQNKRFIDVSKEKDRYKRQWRRCAKKMHSLKVSMYEKSIAHENGQDNAEAGLIDLRKILTKDAVEFEREYGQFRYPRSVPSFHVSSESDELSSFASRRTLSAESSER